MASGPNTSTVPQTFIKQEPGLNGIKIKEEPGLNHHIRSDRLSSFKLPRDLTLGGLIPPKNAKNLNNKKVYTPNLNAVRNKNADVKTSRDTSQSTRGRGGGKNDRGAGRGGANAKRGGIGGKSSNLVQTSGLFSQGSAEHARSSSGYSRSSGGSSSSDREPSSSQMKRPTYVKQEIKLDPDDEQKNIQMILGGDSDDECDDDMLNSDSFMPIKIRQIKQEKQEIKRETEIKIEKTASNESVEYPENIEELFARREPQLVLLQLPDSLPGHGPDIDINPGPSTSNDSQTSSNANPTHSNCTMQHLSEGLVGKLVRYRSGKRKLILGETRFDIDLGLEPGQIQEAMSIITNRTERSGNIINLGQINAKLSATPDWEYLFSKKS